MSEHAEHAALSGGHAEHTEAAGGHAGGTRAVLAALGANLGIAVIKFVAFAITTSTSMLAEAVHSVVDSGNQVLLLVGGKRSRRGAPPAKPRGVGGGPDV